MTQLTATPLTAVPLAAGPLTALQLGAAIRGWVLGWSGTAYATHSAWEMSAYGDSIEGSFTPTSAGSGHQRVISGASAGGSHEILILSGSAAMYYQYYADGGPLQSILGPVAVSGVEYVFTVEYNADGVNFIVNGVTYTDSDTPELAVLTDIARVSTGGSTFPGVIHYLKYNDVTQPQLSRHYRLDDGPSATHLADSLGSGSTDAELFGVDAEDWS